MNATLYAREEGPQCFQAEILSEFESSEAFVTGISRCGLKWYWQSERESGRHVASAGPVTPQHRSLTYLTDQTQSELISDLNEEIDTPNVEHRNLRLFGLQTELAEPIEASLAVTIGQFLRDIGPLEILFDRVQDLIYASVFFRHQISLHARCVLDTWRLDPENPPRVRPYKSLRIDSLESIFRVVNGS